MFRALLLCSSILPSDRPIVWQTCINTSKPALHGFKYLQRSGQEGSFLVLTVSKSFSVIPWFSRTVSEGGMWDAAAVVWPWHRVGIIWAGERPETMTVMMLMVLIKHLYFRYCGMCFSQMVIFDSHNNPRVIGFLFYTWGHWSLTKLRFPCKVYTASSGRARIWTRIFECSLHAAVHGVVKSRTRLSDWTTITTIWVQVCTCDVTGSGTEVIPRGVDPGFGKGERVAGVCSCHQDARWSVERGRLRQSGCRVHFHLLLK